MGHSGSVGKGKDECKGDGEEESEGASRSLRVRVSSWAVSAAARPCFEAA